MVLDKFFGRNEPEGSGDEIDIEEYLNELSVREGKIIESDDITYVKPLELDPEGKVIPNILQELEKNNIVVLNVRSLLGNKVALKELVAELRDACSDLDGDIGRISDDKILLVPAGVRIMHSS